MFKKLISFFALAFIRRELLACFILLQLLPIRPSQAQQKSFVITAQSIDPNTLPFPGQTISMSAEVSNTRDFRLPVRLLAVRDGKFYEIAAPSGLLEANDHPQYKVEIPAPVAELIYQFVLILPDGTAATSQRVSVRRDCIPNIIPSLGELPDEIDGSERFNTLLIDNKRLEQEISNFEKSATEIDALSELIAQ